MATNTFDQYTQTTPLASTFSYTFDRLGSFSAILVKVRLAEDTTFISKTVDVDYTLDLDASQITFIPGFVPPDNAIIRIERATTRERQVDYVSGSTLTERTMDNDTNRLTSVDQEIESDLTRALIKTDDNAFWEGETLPSIRCGQALTGDGWVTKTQVEGMLLGAVGLDATGATVYIFQADGTETQFELSGLQGATREVIDVYVEQVYQSSDGNTFVVLNKNDSDFPSAGDEDDYLEFAVAPVDGAEIEVKVLTGTLLATLEDSSITTAMLQDQSVTTSKMTMGAGVGTRVYVGDTGGAVSVRQVTPADILGVGSLATQLAVAIKAGISIDQILKAAGIVDMNNNRLIGGICTGNDDPDVMSTKQYVDSEISDLSAALGTAAFKFQIFTETDFSAWPTGTLVSYDIPLDFRPDFVIPYFRFSDSVHHYCEPQVYTLNNNPSRGSAAFGFYSRFRADTQHLDVTSGDHPADGSGTSGAAQRRMYCGYHLNGSSPAASIEVGENSGDHWLRFRAHVIPLNYHHFTAVCFKIT